MPRAADIIRLDARSLGRVLHFPVAKGPVFARGVYEVDENVGLRNLSFDVNVIGDSLVEVLLYFDRWPFSHRVVLQKTVFRAARQDTNSQVTIQDLYGLLARDEARNAMIFHDILTVLELGRSPVVITERKDHVQTIAERLAKFAKNVVVLKGGMKAKERKRATEALESIPDGEERVIVATGRYLGEGFDDNRLDTLFLTMPISWRGTLAQYAGRLHRLHTAKREVVIYDHHSGGPCGPGGNVDRIGKLLIP